MKQKDFLADLIGNPARARVLRVFVLNEDEVFTSALLGKRAGISPAVASREIKVLEKLGIVRSKKVLPESQVATSKTKIKKVSKPQTVWFVDADFPHARAIASFVHEISPAQFEAVTNALRGTGKLAAVVLSGNFMGDATRPADLIIAADSFNQGRLERAVKGLELIFGREIRYAAFSTPEFRYRLTIQDRLIRDTLDFPHRVLIDRTRLL